MEGNGGRSRNRTNDTRIFNALVVEFPYISRGFQQPLFGCHRGCYRGLLDENLSHPHTPLIHHTVSLRKNTRLIA